MSTLPPLYNDDDDDDDNDDNDDNDDDATRPQEEVQSLRYWKRHKFSVRTKYVRHWRSRTLSPTSGQIYAMVAMHQRCKKRFE